MSSGPDNRFVTFALAASLLCAGGSVAFAVGPGATDSGLTEDAFVAEVLRGHPAIAARRARLDALQERRAFAGSLPNPTANLMLDDVPVRFREGMPMLRYSAEQMIPWPGKRRLAAEIVDASAEAARARTETTREDLALRARLVHIDLVRVDAMKRVYVRTRELGVSLRQLALARMQASRATYHDVITAELEIARIDSDLGALEAERQGVVYTANALSRQDTARALPKLSRGPLGNAAQMELSRLQALAFDRRSELRTMAAHAEEMRREAKMARLEKYPDLMVGAFYKQAFGAHDLFGLMAGGSIPVFADDRQERQAREAEARAQESLAELAAMKVEIAAELAAALGRWQTAARRVAFLEGTVLPKSREAVNTGIATYGAGTTPMTAIVDSTRMLWMTEGHLVMARTEMRMSRAMIDRITSGHVPP